MDVRMMAMAALAAAVCGCSDDLTAYEKAVVDWEPVYCYQSIGDATCYARPYERDANRLVNFYGPPPRKYALPPPPPPIYLEPPPKERARDRATEARAAPAAPHASAAKPPAEPAAALAQRPAGPRQLGTLTAARDDGRPL